MSISISTKEETPLISWHKLPLIKHDVVSPNSHSPLRQNPTLTFSAAASTKFASVSVAEAKLHNHFAPTPSQLLKHPLAALAFIPRDAALFSAGAFAGAAAKTFTAPLDRIKLLMQTHGVRVGQDSAKIAIGFFQAIAVIGKEEGIRGYWKGNLPQVIRVIPYSAVQLFAYETYKKLFKGQNGELSVVARLTAGAFAGMTATFCCQVLAKTVCLADENSKWIVPRLLFLDSSFTCEDKSNWIWQSGAKMNVMGSLILQTIHPSLRPCQTHHQSSTPFCFRYSLRFRFIAEERV